MGMGTLLGQEWPFRARDAELAVLHAAVERASRSRGAVIVGPAGVGKSRLMSEAVRVAAAEGRPTFTAIATRAAQATPFGVLTPLAPDVPAGRLDDPAAWFAAVTAAVTAGGDDPVLAIDDAHLLDWGSAALVLHLALAGTATVLLTVRRGEPVPDPITALWKEGLAERIDLQPLSRSELAVVLASGLGHDVAADTCDQLAELCRGNVLLAREVALAAVESGSLSLRDGVWRWDGQIVLAPRLVDTVGHRLAGLDDAEREALALVSLGEPIDITLVGRLIDPSALAGLEAAGLVACEGGVARLVHPLHGEVMLAELGRAQIEALTGRLVELLDGPDRAPSDLVRIAAWRLELDGTADPDLLIEAAHRANRSFDHALASRLAGAAFEQTGRADAAVELGHAWNGLDRYDEAEDVLAQVEQPIVESRDAALRQRYLEQRHIASYMGLGRRDRTADVIDRFGTEPALVAGYRAQLALDDGHVGWASRRLCWASVSHRCIARAASEVARVDRIAPECHG